MNTPRWLVWCPEGNRESWDALIVDADDPQAAAEKFVEYEFAADPALYGVYLNGELDVFVKKDGKTTVCTVEWVATVVFSAREKKCPT